MDVLGGFFLDNDMSADLLRAESPSSRGADGRDSLRASVLVVNCRFSSGASNSLRWYLHSLRWGMAFGRPWERLREDMATLASVTLAQCVGVPSEEFSPEVAIGLAGFHGSLRSMDPNPKALLVVASFIHL
ncbi:hypothetical protein R1sor_023013 [Riccia sorocarpa]|uniref:Uncharacterized protein n=1 Tax=Riccia sorocarpa TaxID=122646 RepID=A0ABD3GLI3_9MARC